MNKRMLEQDIARGIAILMVMALHCLTIEKKYYMIMAGLVGFLMPFFFFMSGYNYHSGKRSFKENVMKRTKQVVPPFLIYLTVILFIAGIYYVSTNQYTVKDVFNVYLRYLLTKPLFDLTGLEIKHEISNCVMIFWFIQTFYVGSIVFFAVADRCLKNKWSFVSYMCGLIGITMVLARFNIKLPFYLSEAPTIAAMMLLGAYCGQNKLLEDNGHRKWIIINSIISYLSYVILAYLFKGEGLLAGGILWKDGLKEWGVPLTVLFSLLGSYPFVHFCRLFTKTKYLGSFFAWFGENSMYLLFIHQLIQLFVCAVLGITPFRMSLRSEINDLRTIFVYILVVLFSSLFVIIRGKIIRINKHSQS